MKANKIFGLTVIVLFIGTILAWGINHILDKFVSSSSSLEKPPILQSLIPNKIESPMPAINEQVKFEVRGTGSTSKDFISKGNMQDSFQEEVSESRKSVNEDIQLIEERPPSEETIVATTAPIPSSNITGPPVEPGKVTRELPVFAPFGSYSGPTAITSSTSDSRTADVAQSPSTVFESTEKTYQDISAFVPIENSSGPPIDPKRTYKELPPFTPITNTTGPVVTKE